MRTSREDIAGRDAHQAFKIANEYGLFQPSAEVATKRRTLRDGT
jgi:hypothetical protein